MLYCAGSSLKCLVFTLFLHQEARSNDRPTAKASVSSAHLLSHKNTLTHTYTFLFAHNQIPFLQWLDRDSGFLLKYSGWAPVQNICLEFVDSSYMVRFGE